MWKKTVYYDYSKLFFEGECLYDYIINGKSYNEGKLEYEGEYLFNKKWNGKGYDRNGNIIYEVNKGNCKNIKIYDYKEFQKIEGEYLNRKRNGKGKEYDFSLIYVGENLN